MSHIERLATVVETAASPLSISLLLWLRGRDLLLLVPHHVAVLVHHLTHLSHHLAHLLHHADHPFLALHHAATTHHPATIALHHSVATHHPAAAHHAALSASHHVALFALRASLGADGRRGQHARHKRGSG